MPKPLLQIAYVLIPFLGVEVYFYNKLQGVSGGDMVFAISMIAILCIATVVIGLVTFNWPFRKKLGWIVGLVLSFGAMLLTFEFFLN